MHISSPFSSASASDFKITVVDESGGFYGGSLFLCSCTPSVMPYDDNLLLVSVHR